MDTRPLLNAWKAVRFLLILSALVLLVACTFGGRQAPSPVPVSSVPPEPITLNSVNRNWTGARAQLRYAFQMTKGTDSEGWFESKWVDFSEDGIEVQFLVSDRDAIREIIPKKHILVGASLICDGWSLKRPAKGKDLMVDFHFENYPVRARVIFDDLDLEDLPRAESFLRLKILKLVPRSEQLASPAPIPQPRPAAAPAAEPAAYKPAVAILAASVQPARVRAGEEVELIITYKVEGIPAGVVFEAVEHRVLYQGEQKINAFQEPVNRAAGSFTSSRKVKVPASAKPGYYRFHARVHFAGAESEFEALFEVERP